ncbi:MAG: hypothetical protein AAGE52_39330 [Myxococcota bacterium]
MRARFGWALLLLWVTAGLLLEAAHGFKWSPYLDDALRRELWTLAHAHGVGLALIAIVHANFGPGPAWTRRAILAAALLMPVGFVLGGIAHPESDPSAGIVLVPIGALVLLAALGRTAFSAFARGGDESEDRPPPPDAPDC